MSLFVTLSYGLAALFGAAFAAVELRMLLRYLRHGPALRRRAEESSRSTRRSPDEEAPSVTIQLPLYNERNAANRIIQAAARQDYPRHRFDIQVLDDSTDETTAIVARGVADLQRQGVRIEHVRRDRRTGYKAGALAEGLARSDSDFVAVFDADFAPEKDFLRRILVDSDAFDDPTVAFVQARWAWGTAEHDGWFESVLALLLDRHFQIQKPVRALIGNVTTFNGSGGVWRRAAIDDAGGWASDTLTEDLDLSYRCALAGWHGRYRHDVPVLNELPGNMRAFKLQQRRWSKGNAQCFRKLTGMVLGADDVVEDRWDEAFMLAGYAIHPLLLLSLILWPWAVLHVDRTLFWVLQGFMSLGIVAALVSFLMTVRARNERLGLDAFVRVAGGLCVGMGLMVNNTVGQIQGFLSSGGEFLRTPKRAARHADAEMAALGADTPYVSPLHWTFFAEILAAAYCLLGAALLVREGEGLWAVAMVFWALCFGVMIHLQLVRDGASTGRIEAVEVGGV